VRFTILLALAAGLTALTSCDDDAAIRPLPEDMGIVDGLVDFRLPDVYVPPDMGRLGQFGDLCNEGSECQSGFCLEGPGGGRVCTQRCGDCPTGWQCEFVSNEAVDQGFYCVADRPDLCRPCEADIECDDNEDLCLQIGPRKYCGEACGENKPCPDGYTCTPIERDGATVTQCVPTSGECLPCIDADGDGYGEQDGCVGFDCDDDDPDTHEGATELCDGVDNNCSGEHRRGRRVRSPRRPDLPAPGRLSGLGGGLPGGVTGAATTRRPTKRARRRAATASTTTVMAPPTTTST
jgi:hypothetical protein